MNREILKGRVLGYDINRIFSRDSGFGSFYASKLLEAVLRKIESVEIVLYSNQKKSVLSKFKDSLEYQKLKFRSYMNPLRILVDKKISIFHAFGEFHPENKRIKKVISLTEFSNLTGATYAESDSGRTYEKYINNLDRFDKIICPSTAAAKMVVEKMPERPHDIAVILPGVNFEAAQADEKRDARKTIEKFGIKDEYFLYVGKVEIGKNIPVLVKGYLKFWQRAESVPALVMVSDPGDKLGAGLLRDTELLKSKGKFIVTGNISDEELKHLYVLSRALIHPVATDLYSPQIIEAMSLGIPVICSPEGFGTDLGHNTARFIAAHDPDDICNAMEAVEMNEVYRRKLIESGKKFASKYSWEDAAEQVLDLYCELLRE
jgi:glycosyltransferase involved in cell wall biosynthesis